MSVQLKIHEVEYWSCGLDSVGHWHVSKAVATTCFRKQHALIKKPIIAKERRERNSTILNLWIAGKTYKVTSKETGVSIASVQSTVHNFIWFTGMEESHLSKFEEQESYFYRTYQGIEKAGIRHIFCKEEIQGIYNRIVKRPKTYGYQLREFQYDFWGIDYDKKFINNLIEEEKIRVALFCKTRKEREFKRKKQELKDNVQHLLDSKDTAEYMVDYCKETLSRSPDKKDSLKQDILTAKSKLALINHELAIAINLSP